MFTVDTAVSSAFDELVDDVLLGSPFGLNDLLSVRGTSVLDDPRTHLGFPDGCQPVRHNQSALSTLHGLLSHTGLKRGWPYMLDTPLSEMACNQGITATPRRQHWGSPLVLSHFGLSSVPTDDDSRRTFAVKYAQLVGLTYSSSEPLVHHVIEHPFDKPASNNVIVTWLPRPALAKNAAQQRECEKRLLQQLSCPVFRLFFVSWRSCLHYCNGLEQGAVEFFDLGQHLASVQLFPPRGGHCKLTFKSTTSAQEFLRLFGSRRCSSNLETDVASCVNSVRWMELICRAFDVENKRTQPMFVEPWAE